MKNGPGTRNIHKNQPGTMKNHKDPPGTMKTKNHLQPWKNNLKPWKPIRTDLQPWKTNLLLWKTMKPNLELYRVVTGGYIYRGLQGGIFRYRHFIIIYISPPLLDDQQYLNQLTLACPFFFIHNLWHDHDQCTRTESNGKWEIRRSYVLLSFWYRRILWIYFNKYLQLYTPVKKWFLPLQVQQPKGNGDPSHPSQQ